MSSETPISDFDALEKLFKRYYKPLRAYAYRFVDDKDLSEDIVQDVFFELWQRRASIRFEDEAIKSYLFKAVYHTALNVLTKKQPVVYSLEPGKEVDVLEQYLSSSIQNSEQGLLLKELEEEIKAYVETLPAQCRKVFLLSRSYGLKNREIAAQLDISIKAVEKHISKALLGLKGSLTEKGLFPILILAVSSMKNTLL